jgi:thioredoxin reductase (NADPH)
MKDLIIIGAGPVGLYAGFCAGLRKLDTMIIESSYETGGQLTLYQEKDILDVPGFARIKAKDLGDALREQLLTHANEVSLHCGEEVQEIQKKEASFEVVTNQATYHSKKILIANGGGKFSPRMVDGLEADNVYYHMYDLEQFRNQNIAVLGGGDSAVDWATALLDITQSVTLIHRRTAFRAHQAAVQRFEANGGTILTPYAVEKYVIDKRHIKALELLNLDSNEMSIKDIDAVCIFYGSTKTKVNYAPWQVEFDLKGILVNQKMETSIEGIYAVGNAASYEGKQDMLASGFGEVVTAIGSINYAIHPEQKVPMYSSLLKK